MVRYFFLNVIRLSFLVLILSFTPNKNRNNSKNTLEKKAHTPQNVKKSKILFSRKHKQEKGWSIYSINPDGTGEKIVIPYASGQGEYNPEISPNGKEILFNSYRYGGWKLAVYNIQKKTVKNISSTSNYYTNGSYSNSGDNIAYERNVGRSTQIFISNSNGKNEKLMSVNMGRNNRLPCWTKKEESVLFYSEKRAANDIYIANVKSGEIKNLTNNSSGNDFNPSVSPDGKQVAFFSDRNGYLDLYLMDISGKNQINLTSKLHNISNKYNYYKDQNIYWLFKVSWSPDGEYLVFSNTISDNIDLFTIRNDGSELKQITKTSQSELTPVWGSIIFE